MALSKDEVAAMIEGRETFPRDPNRTYSYDNQLWGKDYEKEGRSVAKLDEIFPSLTKPVEDGDPDPNVRSNLPDGSKVEGQQGGGAEAIPPVTAVGAGATAGGVLGENPPATTE